jgi:hypothetical protein
LLKDKIWENFEIYLFPYAKSAKGINLIEDMIKKTQNNNINNVFKMLDWFFKGEDTFPEAGSSEQWNKELTAKLGHLRSGAMGSIFGKIVSKNSLKNLSIKNFENLLLHSLESEGSKIMIKKQTLGKLLQACKKN